MVVPQKHDHEYDIPKYFTYSFSVRTLSGLWASNSSNSSKLWIYLWERTHNTHLRTTLMASWCHNKHKIIFLKLVLFYCQFLACREGKGIWPDWSELNSRAVFFTGPNVLTNAHPITKSEYESFHGLYIIHSFSKEWNSTSEIATINSTHPRNSTCDDWSWFMYILG